jgi:hypothetical protein
MFYESGKTAVGEIGAGISSKFVEYGTVAALQQDIRYIGGDVSAPRNSQQMRRGLAAGDFDKILIAEPCRLRQYRLCYRNVVISGETPHDFGWRIIDRANAAAEFRERFSLYPLDEVAQDVIENFDLLIIEPIRVSNKEIGNTPQRVDAFVLGAALDRVFQLANK